MKKIALSLFVIASSGAYVLDQAGRQPGNDLIDTQGSANAAEQNTLPLLAPPAPADAVPAQAAASTLGPGQSATQEPAPRKPVEIGHDTSATMTAPAPKTTVAVEPLRSPQLPPPPAKQKAELPPLNAPPQETPAFAVTPAVYIPIPQPRPAYPQAAARVIHTGMKLAGHGYADGVYTGPAADAYYGIIQLQALVQGGRLTALKILKYPNDRRTSVSINRQALPMLRDEAISAQSADVDIISGATLTSRAFIQSLGGALKKASS
ncbi:FMN-binding domain-containing protein [Mesorhizobium hawassense]|uniref:FMN-binding domain-containing protein n=1 Tax=Mesorhizobium hawassense TaxID=1209954 RepID=A0A330HRK6_9HYPH|nr:FMN-binding protein [Mesorhizobium hawassense]RAZ91015.1 FMN-binding domain-containing protein [Mesorhizobium hawassense]